MIKKIKLSDIIDWTIILTDSKNYFENLACKQNLTCNFDNADGLTLFSQAEKFTCIWLNKLNDVDSLIHEIVHASAKILTYHMIKFHDDHEEILCYLIEKIYHRLRN